MIDKGLFGEGEAAAGPEDTITKAATSNPYTGNSPAVSGGAWGWSLGVELIDRCPTLAVLLPLQVNPYLTRVKKEGNLPK